MRWMFNKKQQIMLAQKDGRIDFIEYQLAYCSSSSFHNHKDIIDLSYTAVVDNNFINLTPLGKLLIPPPMFEKQVGLSGPISCVSMHGHLIVALVGDTLNVIEADTGKIQPFKVDGKEVYRILVFKQGEALTVVLVQNRIDSQTTDRVTVVKIAGENLTVVKEMEVPKTYSACISATHHHSGYSDEQARDSAQDNLHYTTLNSSSLPSKAEEISGSSPLFGVSLDEDGKSNTCNQYRDILFGAICLHSVD